MSTRGNHRSHKKARPISPTRRPCRSALDRLFHWVSVLAAGDSRHHRVIVSPSPYPFAYTDILTLGHDMTADRGTPFVGVGSSEEG